MFRCRDCQHETPLADPRALDVVQRSSCCERCGGPLELGRPRADSTTGTPRPRVADRLHLRNLWSTIVETWYAWQVSRRMLRLYQQLRDESGLTGVPLYQQVIMRWLRIDIGATTGILRHAEESFSAWPAWHDLRFRNVVQYVVIYEYLRSHKESLGTHTRMGTTVARVVPNDL